VTYLGSLCYFPTWVPVLPNGRSSERLLLMGGSNVCSMLILVMYPKHAHFTSRTLLANYWGLGRCTPLEQAYIT
jgi:hypothetical protein